MHILLSNDDGYDAQGLDVLAKALSDQHHKVSIVGPRTNMSGCGMGLSLRKSIAVEELEKNKFIVGGTPADCVYLGLQSLIDAPVDMVISGINNGANLADDILYSGTFAAAMEARRLTIPSIALSMTESTTQHYATAAYVASQMVNNIDQLKYKSLLAVLNVNVPEVSVSQLRGLKATVLGVRGEPQKPVKESGKANKFTYRLSAAGDFLARQRRTMQDFEAVQQVCASITPLTAQFDDHAYVKDVQDWLNKLKA